MTAEAGHCTFAQRMVRPVDNPPNPWHATHIEWDGEAPDAKLELFEERARSILSENDSPDIPHRWSVNPYRGCMHACTYCLSAETPVLMGDGSVRAIASLRVGDEIYGTELRGRYRRYVRTRVLAHWSTFKPAWRVRLDDGTELIASGDHRFLSDRGWKHVTGAEQGHARRPHLTTGNSLIGTGAITRKRDIEGQAIKNNARLGVTSVEALGVDLPMFDITTGTGDFIANGVVSHNCYARPSHQHLGFGAGTDFDRKIVVKVNAAELLRDAFERRSWTGDTVMLSGNTDCYQPIEGTYALTRACLTVCADYRNPIAIVTKGMLVRRDIDVLSRLAGDGCATVIVSIPYADDATRKKVEPWASSVEQRFETLRMLSAAGIPTGVMVAPVIPGLNDDDIAEVLTRAHAAGARRAAMQLVRLPGEVMGIFDARMREAFPDRARRIDSALTQVRRGKRTESEFGARMTGSGARWEIIRQLFDTTCKRLGMNEVTPAERMPFRRPRAQLGLFDK